MRQHSGLVRREGPDQSKAGTGEGEMQDRAKDCEHLYWILHVCVLRRMILEMQFVEMADVGFLEMLRWLM